MADDSGQYVSVAQAARIFSKTKSGIRGWIRAGKLKVKRDQITRRVFIPIEAIEERKKALVDWTPMPERVVRRASPQPVKTADKPEPVKPPAPAESTKPAPPKPSPAKGVSTMPKKPAAEKKPVKEPAPKPEPEPKPPTKRPGPFERDELDDPDGDDDDL